MSVEASVILGIVCLFGYVGWIATGILAVMKLNKYKNCGSNTANNRNDTTKNRPE